MQLMGAWYVMVWHDGTFGGRGTSVQCRRVSGGHSRISELVHSRAQVYTFLIAQCLTCAELATGDWKHEID